MGVFTIQANKSNLSIGEVAGTPSSFSCLFCRHSLADSCFDDSVIQKVQETTSRSLDILPKLQFDSFDFVNPIGFSGGLWLCWNFSAISLNVVLKNNIMMHRMEYFPHLILIALLLFFYGYPQHHKQK